LDFYISISETLNDETLILKLINLGCFKEVFTDSLARRKTSGDSNVARL
jgi:hypothetical protein